MKKSQYLGTDEVIAFVEWMSRHLDDATFAHAYTVRTGNRPWACSSLFDAYDKYCWSHVELPEFKLQAGRSIESNLRVLETLQTELRQGLAAADADRVLRAATGVMKWGGVVNHNVTWLKAWRKDLCRIIGETRDAIHSADTDHPLFSQSELRFTSGMSKVYSLVCDDFAIYDSRVAAALCRAVVLFCIDTGRDQVPRELQFPWAAAKSSPNAINPPMRNAAQGNYSFPSLVRGRSYVVWNMKASWLLSAVASHPNTAHSAFARLDSAAQRLRAVEAALFMFGYDLLNRPKRGQDDGSAKPVSPDARTPEPAVANEDGWTRCKTTAEAVPFEYRLAGAADGIQTRDDSRSRPLRFTDAELNRTLQALLGDFADRPFPLANSVDGVPAGRVPNGLGTAFWKETRRSAGYTSRLAAVLESIDVFEACENPPTPAKYWSLNIEALGVDESGNVNIRPYLDSVIQGD